MFEWSKKVLIIMMLLPLALSQVEAQEYEAGIDYEVLPQAIRTANPNKIEVNEVFHYLCIHCYNFEGTIHPWADKLPSDVDFHRTPAIWQTALEPFARAYYTGSLGWVGASGELCLNIIIRSLWSAEGRAFVQAGAGVVADSVPAREYAESLRKAQAPLLAAARAALP